MSSKSKQRVDEQWMLEVSRSNKSAKEKDEANAMVLHLSSLAKTMQPSLDGRASGKEAGMDVTLLQSRHEDVSCGIALG